MSFKPDEKCIMTFEIHFVMPCTFFKFLSVDDAFAIGNLDGVDERIFPEVEVDEGRNDPDLGEPEPRDDLLRAVAHEQSH